MSTIGPDQAKGAGSTTADPAALAKILSYAQSIARNDPAVVSAKTDPPERAALLAARDALFVGVKKAPGTAGKKRKRHEDALANRPCSPSLFSNLASASSSTGTGTSTPQGKRAATLTDRVEHVLSTTVTPLYDRSGGSSSSQGPLEDEKLVAANRFTSLGFLLLPIRRPSVLEKWTPHEIAVFESGLCLHGKKFDVIKELLPNKTTKEVIEFYYVWKNTSHKPIWKKTFKPVE